VWYGSEEAVTLDKLPKESICYGTYSKEHYVWEKLPQGIHKILCTFTEHRKKKTQVIRINSGSKYAVNALGT